MVSCWCSCLQARVIRIPVHIHELMAKMANVETTFRSKHGKAPSQAKLADLVGIPLEKLQLLLKVSCVSPQLTVRMTPVLPVNG